MVGGFLAALSFPLYTGSDLKKHGFFCCSGSFTLVSLPTTWWWNQTCRKYLAGICSNLAAWDKLTGSLLCSGDTSQQHWQDYKTIKIQILGCNLVNYIDKISKGWDWLSDLWFLQHVLKKSLFYEKKPKTLPYKRSLFCWVLKPFSIFTQQPSFHGKHYNAVLKAQAINHE